MGSLVHPDSDDDVKAMTHEPLLAPGAMMMQAHKTAKAEDTPAYASLQAAGVLCTDHRRNSIEAIFTGLDLAANTDRRKNISARLPFYACPILGCCLYNATHTELFVPAGCVGFLMDDKNRYLFAQPGMHNIASMFIRVVAPPRELRGHVKHGNRTIVIVDQGCLGYATDNGQPVLLPPGIHVWTSESLEFHSQVALNDHIIVLGPYTLLTVNEGYAAVTQNNGKQVILDGGHTHFLDHKNWKFEKFMTLKIQTDELEKIQATSADNINMFVTSTVNWRIVDVEVAATMAAETMASSGKADEVAADISKLRRDVLKQALASLAAFIGSVNYSESFHMSAAAQSAPARHSSAPPVAAVIAVGGDAAEEKATTRAFSENPLYDTEKMGSAVDHANGVTRFYGIEIMSINIISARPVDDALTRSLASGAVASAEALQAETAARGEARAVAINAEAEAQRITLHARGEADAARIRAEAEADAERIRAQGAKEAKTLLAEAEAAEVELHAAARAHGIEKVSAALQKPGGQAAMVQSIAESYVSELSAMAQKSNLIMVPEKVSDVSSVLTTALAIGKNVPNLAGDLV